MILGQEGSENVAENSVEGFNDEIEIRNVF